MDDTSSGEVMNYKQVLLDRYTGRRNPDVPALGSKPGYNPYVPSMPAPPGYNVYTDPSYGVWSATPTPAQELNSAAQTIGAAVLLLSAVVGAVITCKQLVGTLKQESVWR